MFYLPRQGCQVTGGLGGHRTYCTWGLGAAGIVGWISTGTKLRWIISALSSTDVVATGKTEGVLANWKDAMGPNWAYRNGPGGSALCYFRADDGVTFPGKTKLSLESGIETMSVLQEEEIQNSPQ